MVDEEEAHEFCQKIALDEGESEMARSYASKGQGLTGSALETQLNYVWGNLKKEENKDELRDILGINKDEGYRDGYCQMCGNRDDDAAYRSEDSAGSGLVCVGCYEDFGEPDSCEDCGKTTYEGDYLVESNEFYCNSCL